MKVILKCMTLIMIPVVTGCWSLNYNEPGRIDDYSKYPTEMVVNRGFADSWEATKQVMAKFPMLEHKLDLKSDRAYLVTDWIRGKSDVLYSGYVDEARIPYVIRYKLYVYVVGDNMGKRTRVSVKNTEDYLTDVITAELDFNRSIYQWVRTKSSTLKEHNVLTEIRRALKIPEKN